MPFLKIFCLLVLTSFAARATTIPTGVLMAGTRYKTPYFIKVGEEKGPTIVVIGGAHGDEPAGFLAARELRGWTVTRGKLVVVPDAHAEAIRRGVRGYPRNMNALFPGKKNGDAMEKLAFEIWELVKASKPDLLLTLHESRGFHVDDPKRYGQTFTYDFAELRPRFGRVAVRVNSGIGPTKNHFLQLVAPFPTCPTFLAWKWLRVPATSIETAKPLPLALRIDYQKRALRGFFSEWGLEWQEVPVRATAPRLRPS